MVADYEGETLAVDENTGNLYSGTSELTLAWGDDDNCALAVLPRRFEGGRGSLKVAPDS